MKVNLFSSLLIILMLALTAKAITLLSRIEEQTIANANNSSVTSAFVETAYAKDGNNAASLDPKHVIIDKATGNLQRLEDNPLKTVQEPAAAPTRSLPADMSNAELQLLKELSKRREKLDKIYQDIDLRCQVLKATESKIEQKISELSSLQGQVEEVMKQYNQKEAGKIISLVKIYENMKPRDAAKIFDGLEMPVLLQVVSRMKEIKVAHVIASMNLQKARDLSLELAKQKTLN